MLATEPELNAQTDAKPLTSSPSPPSPRPAAPLVNLQLESAFILDERTFDDAERMLAELLHLDEHKKSLQGRRDERAILPNQLSASRAGTRAMKSARPSTASPRSRRSRRRYQAGRPSSSSSSSPSPVPFTSCISPRTCNNLYAAQVFDQHGVWQARVPGYEDFLKKIEQDKVYPPMASASLVTSSNHIEEKEEEEEEEEEEYYPIRRRPYSATASEQQQQRKCHAFSLTFFTMDIGMALSFVPSIPYRTQGCVASVSRVISGGQAERLGVMVGDIVSVVNGIDVTRLRADAVRKCVATALDSAKNIACEMAFHRPKGDHDMGKRRWHANNTAAGGECNAAALEMAGKRLELGSRSVYSVKVETERNKYI